MARVVFSIIVWIPTKNCMNIYKGLYDFIQYEENIEKLADIFMD